MDNDLQRTKLKKEETYGLSDLNQFEGEVYSVGAGESLALTIPRPTRITSGVQKGDIVKCIFRIVKKAEEE